MRLLLQPTHSTEEQLRLGTAGSPVGTCMSEEHGWQRGSRSCFGPRPPRFSLAPASWGSRQGAPCWSSAGAPHCIWPTKGPHVAAVGWVPPRTCAHPCPPPKPVCSPRPRPLCPLPPSFPPPVQVTVTEREQVHVGCDYTVSVCLPASLGSRWSDRCRRLARVPALGRHPSSRLCVVFSGSQDPAPGRLGDLYSPCCHQALPVATVSLETQNRSGSSPVTVGSCGLRLPSWPSCAVSDPGLVPVLLGFVFTENCC